MSESTPMRTTLDETLIHNRKDMLLLWFLVCAAPFLLAQSDSQRGIEVLRANCTSCHGTAMQMSGLRLDSRDGLLKGGSKGPAIVS